MKLLHFYLAIILLLSIVGCDNSPYNKYDDMAVSELAAFPDNSPDEITGKKLIKEGHVVFESYELDSTRQKIFRAIAKYEGYVSSDQEFKRADQISNTIIARIPAGSFDNFLNDATQGVKKFDSKNIDIKDVTEEFVDVEARLKTKKELEARFLELLNQAKTVTEILEIEVQIGNLRADIESIEGRLNYLKSQVSFSTLTITFYENLPDQQEFGRKFKTGFRNGWDNLILFFVMLTNVWPFILLILGIILGWKFHKTKK